MSSLGPWTSTITTKSPFWIDTARQQGASCANMHFGGWKWCRSVRAQLALFWSDVGSANKLHLPFNVRCVGWSIFNAFGLLGGPDVAALARSGGKIRKIHIMRMIHQNTYYTSYYTLPTINTRIILSLVRSETAKGLGYLYKRLYLSPLAPTK